MPSRAREVHSNLFMVRVWPEEVDEGRVEWRGKVQHVASGETRYFRDWESMLAFLRGDAPDPAVEGSQEQTGQQDGQGSEAAR
jgi:hypothetical protein